MVTLLVVFPFFASTDADLRVFAFSAPEQARRDQDVGGGDVRRERHISHIADSHQGLNVRIVWMLVQRIDNEKDGIDRALYNPVRDLNVTPVRP
jgi:hypothetical protein